MSRLKRSPRNSVHDRPGRLKLLWRRARRRAGLIGAVLAVLLLLGLAGLGLRAGGAGGVLAALGERAARAGAGAGLRVERIEIAGRANTPEPLLRAAIGVAPGDAILAVPLAEIRARIETLSWVQSARVERRLPGTLFVELTERRPFAIWQHQGRFRLIDRDGEVVDQDLAMAKDLPLVVGAGAPAAAGALLDIVGRHPALLARMIAAVRVGERRWNLRLNTGADVLLPEGHEAAAIARLMSLHQDIALLDRPVKVVDMRLPDRLVVRPQTETRPDEPQPRGAPARRPT
jgi:cell division protein FtsQ